jgi:hypothetical protein
MLAKLIAVVIHEVVTEYRKLDGQQNADAAPAADDSHRYDPASTTAADTERAPSWDQDKEPPVRAFGFRSPVAGPPKTAGRPEPQVERA